MIASSLLHVDLTLQPGDVAAVLDHRLLHLAGFHTNHFPGQTSDFLSKDNGKVNHRTVVLC